MKWLWLLLLDPARALDWYDARKPSRLDHGKVVSTCVLAVLVGLVVAVAWRTGTYPPLGWGIVVLAGSFGSRMFLAFLHSWEQRRHESQPGGAGVPGRG